MSHYNARQNDGCRLAQVIEVIQTTCKRGEGIEGDPVREVKQYWAKEGYLLAEYDAWEYGHTAQPKEDSR